MTLKLDNHPLFLDYQKNRGLINRVIRSFSENFANLKGNNYEILLRLTLAFDSVIGVMAELINLRGLGEDLQAWVNITDTGTFFWLHDQWVERIENTISPTFGDLPK